MFFNKIRVIKSTTSTNDEIKNIIKDGLFLIAKKQTAGKTSKKGLKWKSGEGNLYLSSSHKISDNLKKELQTIGLIASHSAVQTIKSIANKKDKIQSKWPNDIIFNGMKLGGILCEKHNDFIIIGIGLNLAQTPKNTFSGTHKKIPATSLKDFGISITPKQFTKIYKKELLKNIKLLEKNDFEHFIKKLKIEKNYFNLGKEIDIKTEGKILTGTFKGLDQHGFLLLQEKRKRKITTIKTIDI